MKIFNSYIIKDDEINNDMIKDDEINNDMIKDVAIIDIAVDDAIENNAIKDGVFDTSHPSPFSDSSDALNISHAHNNTPILHVPVMLNEAIDHLNLQDGGIYVDSTFGGGGYTKEILKRINCSVYAFDVDPDALERSKAIVNSNFKFILSSFSKISEYIDFEIDGIVYDLGLSSFQLGEAHRGFSFNFNAKLDMRMSKKGISAFDIVNTFSEEDLSEIIYRYGEEKKSRSITSLIIEKRKDKKIETTFELKEIIHSIIKKRGKIDPATRTFQALRIFINDELIELKESLSNIKKLVRIGGHCVIVAFHGLENLVIKEWLRDNKCWKVTKKLKPTFKEISINPRSRSACLWVFERKK